MFRASLVVLLLLGLALAGRELFVPGETDAVDGTAGHGSPTGTPSAGLVSAAHDDPSVSGTPDGREGIGRDAAGVPDGPAIDDVAERPRPSTNDVASAERVAGILGWPQDSADVTRLAEWFAALSAWETDALRAERTPEHVEGFNRRARAAREELLTAFGADASRMVRMVPLRIIDPETGQVVRTDVEGVPLPPLEPPIDNADDEADAARGEGDDG